jgi:hypothetical protein
MQPGPLRMFGVPSWLFVKCIGKYNIILNAAFDNIIAYYASFAMYNSSLGNIWSE